MWNLCNKNVFNVISYLFPTEEIFLNQQVNRRVQYDWIESSESQANENIRLGHGGGARL